MKDLSRFLIVVSDTLVKYHEPQDYEGYDYSIKFHIRKHENGYWYNSGSEDFDFPSSRCERIECASPIQVVNAFFEALELATQGDFDA